MPAWRGTRACASGSVTRRTIRLISPRLAAGRRRGAVVLETDTLTPRQQSEIGARLGALVFGRLGKQRMNFVRPSLPPSSRKPRSGYPGPSKRRARDLGETGRAVCTGSPAFAGDDDREPHRSSDASSTIQATRSGNG